MLNNTAWCGGLFGGRSVFISGRLAISMFGIVIIILDGSCSWVRWTWAERFVIFVLTDILSQIVGQTMIYLSLVQPP